MELTTLRYFRAIAKAGHMTRAAHALGVTQPALSAVVKKLEAEVGTTLLHRTGRGVQLTEAGRVFLAHTEETLRRADNAVSAVRELMGLQTGSIRVGGGATATTYLLPPAIGLFRRDHPGVRFYVREHGSSSIAAAVISGELDLGIVTLPLKRSEGADLLTTALAEDELRLITPPGHRLAEKKSFSWKDLEGERVVAFEAGSAVRELIDRSASSAGAHLDVVMELRSIESIKRSVAAGIGVGFVSRFALDASQPGASCRDGKLVRSLAIAKPNDRALSPAARAFETTLLQAARRS
ncbi:MAG: LysR substrate-binding domain-containing protein [Phycisphaerales bacterium]